MKTKVCKKCGVNKELTIINFYTEKRNTDGFTGTCRECINKRFSDWCNKNHNRKKEISRKSANKQYKLNPNKFIKRNNIWYKNNPEKYKKMYLERYWSNPEKYRKKAKEWSQNNPEKYKKMYLERNRKIRSTPEGKINHRMEVIIRRALQENKNGRSWERIVGYTKDDLKNHLEGLFKDGMNWEEFMKGNIHIDHIKPRCLFKYKLAEDEEFQKCWALGNLQPLWAHENLIKNKKYVE